MSRIVHSAISVLFLSLITLCSADTAVIAAEELAWRPQEIPEEGEAGRWQLAAGSDINCIAVTADGALYAAVEGLEYNLFKSINEGYEWTPLDSVSGRIIDIEADEIDEDTVYCATESGIYKTTDGNSFLPLAILPAMASGSNVEITDIDTARYGGSNIVIAATRDSDTGEYGGVYLLNEAATFTQWQDLGIGEYDVYAAALSPEFEATHQIIAVVNDESETAVIIKTGDGGWGDTIGDAKLESSPGVPLEALQSAVIAFPDDYSPNPEDGSCVQYVAVDSGDGNGDVYAVYGKSAPESSEIEDLNIAAGYGLDGIDICGLSVCGGAQSACLLAGAAACGQIYSSYDGGVSWERSIKEPTGQYDTRTLVIPASSGFYTAYAATSGAGSALSVSRNGGVSWNQARIDRQQYRDGYRPGSVSCL